TLSDKQLFASVGADGMTIDSTGNVYLCEDSVLVFDQSGNQIETITLPNSQTPTNASFGGLSNHILYITTKTSLYSLNMNVAGADFQDSSNENQENQENQEEENQTNSSNDDSSSCFILSAAS
ncbi:MAG: SMP-30/gluconolactonase/LRE family protein, partial [Desulfobacteraceae bacterium]|nr:SMP-30/gluconolactonase/LRE family protein [Desulfobacteraceae bacterium]